LLVAHGLAEHSGRYINVVNYFVPKGYAVCGFDYQGHGKSEGLLGYVKRFSCYLDELGAFLDILRDKYPENKIYIVGHSVGGNIAATFAANHQDEFDGLILSGATIKPGTGLSRVKIVMANFLSLILPKMGVDIIDASAISRDKAVVDAYINDPLVYRGKISARLGVELIRAMQELTHQMPQIKLHIMIMHGTDDRLCDPEGSLMLYERVSSPDKTLKLYDGLYHEIFNEPEREQVFKDMETWLIAHI
jgi:alpha-beta hydrolase superfamily lysophospholipase